MNRPAAVTASERSLRAQDVVNAADGWAGEVAALAGLTVMGKRNYLPRRPRRGPSGDPSHRSRTGAPDALRARTSSTVITADANHTSADFAAEADKAGTFWLLLAKGQPPPACTGG
ncbi:hypothetical protein ACWDKQ_26110 [Saccharopolyspora sp. NPDC000995]